MRQTLLLLSLSLMLVVPALAQSGRKDPPKPSPAPSPPETRLLELKKSSKPLPPEIVDGERIYGSREVDERVRILKKPLPSYTREARRRGTRGLVVLRVVLASDETVKHIQVKTGLPDGLSENAIDAARRIKFKPALKDGKPVSVRVLLEYRFSIY
jgi:protein TonB